ncbi:MAG: hypothetical protein AAF614_09160 [Chloroflexota bacterium]
MQRNQHRTYLFFVLLFVLLWGHQPHSQAATSPILYNFPAAPAAYVHPRVFVSAAELPALERRLTSAGFGANVTPWLKNKVTNQVNAGAFLRTLADMSLDPNNVTDAEIDASFFDYGEFDSHDLAIMALWGAIFTNGEANYVAGAKETAVSAATNYAIIAQNIHQRYLNGDYSGLDATTTAAIQSHWNQQSNYTFKLQHIRRNGGLGLALAYDMLYNEMTTDQQDTIRQALSIGTTGWNIWGGNDNSTVGLDRNAVSNHYGYQGDQAVMLAAIYGEAGFSQTDWDAIVQVLQNYMRVGFYASGYPIEDSYGPDLGLREGSRGLIALARQGVNEFAARPNEMVNIGKAIAHDVESVPNGALIGGESGGNYAFSPSSPAATNVNPTYPTFHIVWKHVFPTDETIDWLYRWRMGDDYRRIWKSQSTVDYAFFGGDYDSLSNDGRSLTQYFPQRGKVVTRNNLTNNAVQFAFDARPDAFNIGHDKAGRGFFSLNGLGRRWVVHLNFRDVRFGDESSTVQIDGVGQPYKTPSVKMIEEPTDDGILMTATADLKYAYDWQWNQPWTTSSGASPNPDGSDPNWEHETIDPATFFVSGAAPNWLPNSLWDSANHGYRGMWMWRRPHLPVQKAFRSVAYVRTTAPFVIIADDIRQDNSSHLYESLLQLPYDLDQMTVNGNDAILWATGENTRLLVRVLQAETTAGGVGFTNEAYTTSVTGMAGRRLRVGVTAVEPKLKMMLWPHLDGDTLPQTSWNGAKSEITASGEGVEQMVLGVDETNGYALFSDITPSPAAPLIGISKSGMSPNQTAEIDWDDIANAAAYDVYRDVAPYFDPATALSVVDQSDYQEALAPPTNYYFVAKAADGLGRLSPSSNRVGIFHFELVGP